MEFEKILFLLLYFINNYYLIINNDKFNNLPRNGRFRHYIIRIEPKKLGNNKQEANILNPNTAKLIILRLRSPKCRIEAYSTHQNHHKSVYTQIFRKRCFK